MPLMGFGTYADPRTVRTAFSLFFFFNKIGIYSMTVCNSAVSARLQVDGGGGIPAKLCIYNVLENVIYTDNIHAQRVKFSTGKVQVLM